MGGWRRSLTTWLEPEPAGPSTSPASPAVRRASLGLQQFLPALLGTVHPTVLDLGCVWQATVSLLTDHGCKLYAEDLFLSLGQLMEEPDREPSAVAERFLETTLEYPAGSFRGILAWDLFDYLPEELLQPLAERLYELLEPGGAWLGLFRSRREEVPFLRYRVADPRTLELLPGPLPLRRQRAFQNRELLNLFSAFRASRTFIGRDHLRELLLLK